MKSAWWSGEWLEDVGEERVYNRGGGSGGGNGNVSSEGGKRGGGVGSTKGICYAFEKGKCERGANCKFSHDTESQSSGRSVILTASNLGGGVDEGVRNKSDSGGGISGNESGNNGLKRSKSKDNHENKGRRVAFA